MIIAGFETATGGIAREMAVLQHGRPAVLVWRSAAASVVVPAPLMRNAAVTAAARAAERSGWPVASRRTGGGIVPQGPGTLNLAMVTPCPRGFRHQDGYRLICGAITETLARFDVPSSTGPCARAFCDGQWNVLIGGRKLAGTAQRWTHVGGRQIALIHAAILTKMPDAAAWRVMDDLHRAAFPESAGLQAGAHTALAQLFGAHTAQREFSGALARVAEDRLMHLHQNKTEAA